MGPSTIYKIYLTVFIASTAALLFFLGVGVLYVGGFITTNRPVSPVLAGAKAAIGAARNNDVSISLTNSH